MDIKALLYSTVSTPVVWVTSPHILIVAMRTLWGKSTCYLSLLILGIFVIIQRSAFCAPNENKNKINQVFLLTMPHCSTLFLHCICIRSTSWTMTAVRNIIQHLKTKTDQIATIKYQRPCQLVPKRQGSGVCLNTVCIA